MTVIRQVKDKRRKRSSEIAPPVRKRRKKSGGGRYNREGPEILKSSKRRLQTYDPMPGKRVRAERAINVLLHARRARSKGITMNDVVMMPRFDDTDKFQAIDKRLERDLKLLESIGLRPQYHQHSRYCGQGYVFEPRPPRDPAEVYAERRTARRAPTDGGWIEPVHRYAWILYRVESGQRPTVQQMAKELYTTEKVIREDIRCMTLCCAGREPHLYLDAREEDGEIVITGPTLFRGRGHRA